MSKLYYRYGAMNSGKSTALIQVAYNYEERDQLVYIIKPAIDTKANTAIQSRLGYERNVDLLIGVDDNLLERFVAATESSGIRPDCVLVDEAQFLTRQQINGLFLVAVQLGIPVIAYGIRVDFKGNAFPGSARLLELAHSLEELKTICRCGRKATINGRKINGEFVSSGSQVAIDGQEAEYESLCGKCYLSKVGPLD